MTARNKAERAMKSHFQGNAYPGRGLIIGRSANGAAWQQVYFIMGRSPNSRNRRFRARGSVLETEPFDPSKVEDPSLIIYEAMLEFEDKFLVSNGDQTSTTYQGISQGKSFRESLKDREREPDAPNYTPRITGMLDLSKDDPEIALSILKANQLDPAKTDRHFFYPGDPDIGFGYGLTTYMGDGSPLPSYTGDPLNLPLFGDPEETLERYWSALDEENRISIAVKEILTESRASKILTRNKYH